mgnify:CR=1 FL=1
MSDEEIIQKTVTAVSDALKELRAVTNRVAGSDDPTVGEKFKELHAKLQKAVDGAFPILHHRV